MHTVAQDFINQLDNSLSRFGTYAFDDKGPNEVLDIHSMVKKLRALKVDDVATILTEISESSVNQARCRILASALVVNMEGWNELFEFDIAAELFNEYI